VVGFLFFFLSFQQETLSNNNKVCVYIADRLLERRKGLASSS
jgi:hypothetical protein